MMDNVRKETRRVLEMAEDGVIDWWELAEMCLNWMSEDDVVEMLRANDLIFDEEDEEEIEIDTLYHDCSEDELRKMGCFDNLNEEIEDEQDF